MTTFSRRAAVLLRRHAGSRRTRVASAVVGTVFVASYTTRTWRHKHLQDLALAKDVLDESFLKLLASNATRASLMRPSKPGAKSVKEELNTIRKWHQDRGFLGGLVLRELTQPLYGRSSSADEDIDPLHLRQRECYYLYYEIRGNGEIRQQIFCRGTTLLADVATCLQSWWTWDEELNCKLHSGFKKHADRLLKDVEPLLVPLEDQRATVELCGHSLGGAVAFLVAMKLRRRGYNVVRVTSYGAPRVCHKESLQQLTEFLPPESLRVEDDYDPVPYLPPFGAHLGNKLWFVSSGAPPHSVSLPARYVPFQQSPSWVDSFWINFRLPEILKMPKPHRVPNYVSRLNELSDEMKKQ